MDWRQKPAGHVVCQPGKPSLTHGGRPQGLVGGSTFGCKLKKL